MLKNKDIDNFAIQSDLEKQEDLTHKRLMDFNIPKESLMIDNNLRPKSHLIDLMSWCADHFCKYINCDPKNTTKFLHNKIVIDGQFLHYCDTNAVKVDCLYKDAIVSWKTDSGKEKFFTQGVFKVSKGKLSFLHAALFHKGTNNEDEITFFIILENDKFEEYVKFRNDYEEWLLLRDRSNSLIRVIDGEDIPYDRDSTWESLFLPEKLKNDIKMSVEGFLLSKDFYHKSNIPWKRGILLHGEPGCHAKGTPILMFDGSWKNAEDVQEGDLLMGPDSTPREVLRLARGKEEMYKITPKKGKSFIVNKNHILHLKYSSNTKNNFPSYSNISVDNYLKLSQCLKEKLKLVKCDELTYDAYKGNNTDSLEIDPYILGVWLGDGTTGEPEITSADPEIIQACEKFAISKNLNYNLKKDNRSKVFTINFSHKNGHKNYFTEGLRKLGIFNKKSIPEKYLTSTIEARQQLLAGIIDTDGFYNNVSWKPSEKYNKKGHKGCFDLIQKDSLMSKQVVDLALSLGLGCTINICNKTIKSTGFSGEYFRMSIYGNINKIPTKLPRKIALKGRANKDCRFIGIKSIEPIGVDNFYGFTVDKDHLYVMDNFWITHNCGKTSLIKTIIANYNFKPVTIVPGANDDAMREAFTYAQEQSPALLYFEDLDSLLQTINVSSFLNLMDGVSSKNGLLVVATANDLSKLKNSITDRPSRFDRKFEVPLPDVNMASKYLNKWLDKFLSKQKITQLATHACKYNFSYAYLKELYISSIYNAMAENRQKPSLSDVDRALEQLMTDKSLNGKGRGVGIDKYLKKK